MENLIKRLDLNSVKHLYSQLYKIRSEYIKDDKAIELFGKAGGVSKIIEVLARQLEVTEKSSQNEKITEVILSILGNCTFSNESCAVQAHNSNVIEHVISLVNNSDNPSILSKACRLMGNLAQFQKIALNLQAKGIALSISNCLADDASRSVLTMAVRAIRLMWKSKRFRTEIFSFGSIYKIMVILYKLLKNDSVKSEENRNPQSEMVILKRLNEPDRTITKEQLSRIIDKMEKNDVEINYEIIRPDTKTDKEFMMPAEKDELELVSGIVKCLLVMTSSSSAQASRSVYADGFGVTCLIFLAGETNKFRTSALSIINNLSMNPSAMEYLGINNDLVTNVASLLLTSEQLDKPLDTNEKKNCMNILCLSSENACSRLKLRRSGVFKSLLTAANTTSNDKDLALLIFTFYQFRFDQMGLDNLIDMGLIDVLIKILADLIEEKEVDHINFDDPSLDDERKEDQKLKQRKRSQVDPPVGLGSFSKFMRYDPGSPSSSSSGYASQQFSPSRNSGYSPFNSPSRYYLDCDDSDSDIYSPVCSDNEESQEKKEDFDILTFLYENDEIGKPAELMELDDEATKESENDPTDSETAKRPETIPDTLRQIEADPLQFVLQLLWMISNKKSESAAFVRPHNLQTLQATCKLVQKPNGKIFQILENILTQTKNFVAILQQNFVLKIRELNRPACDHSSDCYSCSKMKTVSRDLLRAFGTVAESGYGRGELARFLITGDDVMRKKIAVNLIHSISCFEILNDFLFRNKVLETIFEMILSEEHLAMEAADGITIMAINLNICIPSDDDVLKRIEAEEFEEDEDLLKSEGDQVKLVLKDGEISLNKSTLTTSSEVFNSMFTGEYRESTRNEVNFPNYTVTGMKYFFQILKMSETGKLRPVAPKVSDMNVVLEAYELSILYIITNIQKPLLNVIKIVLDETSVQKIFEWSLRNVNQDLLLTAVCYFLCGDIDGEAKLKLFLAANQSQYKNEWKQLLVDTILMKCQPTL